MKIDPVKVGGLTPHQDAHAMTVKLMREHFAERIKRPGSDGTVARVQLAMLEAYSAAMAYERDIGSQPAAVIVGVSHGVADIAQSVIVSSLPFVDAATWIEGVTKILDNAHARALESLQKLGRGDTSEFVGVGYHAAPTERAD